MPLETLTYERSDRIGILTFNTPRRLNAISETGLSELEAALEAIERDCDLGALVLTGGTASAFCVGLDLELLDRAFADLAYFETVVRRLAAIAHRIEQLGMPTVAAVNGWARAAGFEFSLACDFLLMADDARFGDVHTDSGLLPIGGALRLRERVGEQHAKELVWSSRWWTAAEAVANGLALKSVPLARLHDEAMALARSMASKPRPVIQASKEVFQQQHLRDAGTSTLEVDKFLENLAVAPYARQAYAAFREGRQPPWKASAPRD